MAYTNEQRRKYYQKNKEKVKAKQRLYYENNREFCKARQIQYRIDNPETVRLGNKRQNQNRKLRLLDYIGTRSCQLCGYDTCIEALDFHHVDPSQKDLLLHKKDLTVEVKAELDKCMVLCANCHREVHSGFRQIEQENKIQK